MRVNEFAIIGLLLILAFAYILNIYDKVCPDGTYHKPNEACQTQISQRPER